MKKKQLNNYESINLNNLIKYWIKFKTIDLNNLKFVSINNNRLNLEKLLFEKSLMCLDIEYLSIEEKFFCLKNSLENLNLNFSKTDDDENILIIIKSYNLFENIKQNNLIKNWTNIYNELWIYNENFKNQLLLKLKLEEIKKVIKKIEYNVTISFIKTIFCLIKNIIKCNKKEKYLSILQTILIQLAVEIEKLLNSKNKIEKNLIIRKLAYFNSKNFLFYFISENLINKDLSFQKNINSRKNSLFNIYTENLNLKNLNKDLIDNCEQFQNKKWFKFSLKSNLKEDLKFKDLINKQQVLNINYQSIKLLNDKTFNEYLKNLEDLYSIELYSYIKYYIQNSKFKISMQIIINEKENLEDLNQFKVVFIQTKNDFFYKKINHLFYEYNLSNSNHINKEKFYDKLDSFINLIFKFLNNLLITDELEDKTSIIILIKQLEQSLDSMLKILEKVNSFNKLNELISILIKTELINEKIVVLEKKLGKENLNYSNFINQIQHHLLNRLELLLELKIFKTFNENFYDFSLENSWMKNCINDVFDFLIKLENKTVTNIQKIIEKKIIRKFNIFLIKVNDLILEKNKKKTIDNFEINLNIYLTWIQNNYPQYVKPNIFPIHFLKLIVNNSTQTNNSNYSTNLKASTNRNQIVPYFESNFNDFNEINKIVFKSDIKNQVKIFKSKSCLQLFLCLEKS